MPPALAQTRDERVVAADSVQWRLYEHLAAESSLYNAIDKWSKGRGRYRFKWLAPFDPAQDEVQPENLVEAERLAALSPRQITITVRDEAGPLRFVSGWPEEF